MHLRKNTRVEIVDSGLLYSTYTSMATKMQLINFEYGYCEVYNGQTGRIIALDFHETFGHKLYAVRMDKSRKDIIIGYNGVINYKSYLLEMQDDLFRI